jgi:hypothetical protein
MRRASGILHPELFEDARFASIAIVTEGGSAMRRNAGEAARVATKDGLSLDESNSAAFPRRCYRSTDSGQAAAAYYELVLQ